MLRPDEGLVADVALPLISNTVHNKRKTSFILHGAIEDIWEGDALTLRVFRASCEAVFVAMYRAIRHGLRDFVKVAPPNPNPG